jgi:hypothetical protein
VAETAVGADLGQPLDVLGSFASQLALDLARLDGLAKLHDLVLGQVLDLRVGIDAGLADDVAGRGAPDAEHVRKADLHALVGGNVDPGDSSHPV